MEQRATVEFDSEAKLLTIDGELMPITSGVHDALVDFLVGKVPTSEFVTFAVVNNVIRYHIEVSQHDGLPSAQDLEIAELRKEVAKFQAQFVTGVSSQKSDADDLGHGVGTIEVKEMTAADAAAEALKPHGA